MVEGPQVNKDVLVRFRGYPPGARDKGPKLCLGKINPLLHIIQCLCKRENGWPVHGWTDGQMDTNTKINSVCILNIFLFTSTCKFHLYLQVSKDVEVACWVVHGMSPAFNCTNQHITYFSRLGSLPPKCIVPENDAQPPAKRLTGWSGGVWQTSSCFCLILWNIDCYGGKQITHGKKNRIITHKSLAFKLKSLWRNSEVCFKEF